MHRKKDKASGRESLSACEHIQGESGNFPGLEVSEGANIFAHGSCTRKCDILECCDCQ